MKTDIILPPFLMLSSKGKFKTDVENKLGNVLDEECVLLITIIDKEDMTIEYHSDANVHVLHDLYPKFNNQCTKETFVSKQYEIANLLNINTVDI